MKKIIACVLILMFVAGVVPAYAQKATKGASQKAMVQASDKAVFHRVSDWFATRGKTPEEAQAIVAERDAKRAADKAQKELQKKQKEMEKATKDAQKKMKKGLGK